MDVAAPDAALKLRPIVFDGVGVMDATAVLAGRMVDRTMDVAGLRQVLVGAKRISGDRAAALDVAHDGAS